MSETSREFLQRFAISGLSKERKDEAINEEILLGKYTGEFFIKSKDGVIISTDILNRLKSSTENAIRYAESAGMIGDLYRIEFDNINMPCHIDYDVNILGNETINLGQCNEFLLNFDYDEFDIVGDEVRPVNGENIVQLTIEVVKINGFVEEVVIEKSMQVINQSIIDLKEYESAKSFKITSIDIFKDGNVFNDDAKDRTIILHNIFVVLNN